MRKYIGLILSVIVIAILTFHISHVAKKETGTTMFLIPLGAVFHIMSNRTKQTKTS
ncbi:MAG: hypothetical protein ACI9IP_002522 [Arcticibacterium sp.]|jgi:hypothetical protein